MTEPLIDPALLEIMQCPVDGGELSEKHDPDVLACSDCGRRYPVRDGIPVMLVDEALPPA
jgi:uncharacterized protein YbaR (Trm112 family)